MHRTLLGMLSAAAIAFCCGHARAEQGAAPAPPSSPKLREGEKAPDFSLRDMDGNLVRLSDFAYPGKEKPWGKKKKVLIDFFRTDCVPCKKELPEVVGYFNKHKEEVHVMLIALLEADEGREKLDDFLQKNAIPFPILVDAYETVAKKYIVDGESVTLPSLFFLDEDGLIRARFTGLKEDLEAALSKVVAELPPKAAEAPVPPK